MPDCARKKILITNAIALNGGDAAILQATVGILKRHFGDDLEVTVHDMAAAASAHYYPSLAFHPDVHSELLGWTRGRFPLSVAAFLTLAAAKARNLPVVGALLRRILPGSLQKCLSDYAEADLIISSGGTYLVPHYSIRSKLLDFLVAEATGRPLILFTQSLGPFPPGRWRPLLRHALRHALLVLVRDGRSRRHLRELGIPEAHIGRCADAAFALAPKDLKGKRFSPDHLAPRIAISVRDWPHFKSRSGNHGMESYCAVMAELVKDLIERRGAHLTFISTCQGAPEYWTDDSRMAEQIVSRLPERLRRDARIDHRFRRPNELIDALSSFDLTIATRLHAAILSLCAGTPVLPIAYEFKTSELFQRFGLGDAVIDIETMSPATVREAYEAAATLWGTKADETWAAVRRERDSAFSAAGYIARALKNGQPRID